MKDYQIVYSQSWTGIITQVRALMKEGWIPQGGISGSYMDGFFQSMVR
jgi:hypothetical protein